MPTYLEYDRISLDYCWDHVQYVSAHRYSNNGRNDSAWFLAEGVEIQRVIDDYRGLFAYVRGKRRSNKQVHLSFDEWNVWYKNMEMDGKWTEAPHLLEEVYNLEDALVCAQYLTAFVRNADVVKIACIAQMVNVIAPILTRRDGLLIQSIYHPLAWFAKHAKGQSLQLKLEGSTYKAGERGDVPAIDAAVTHDPASKELAIFVVNRDGAQELTVNLDDRSMSKVVEAAWLGGSDLKLDNTWDHPDRVKPTSIAAQLNGAKTLKLSFPSPGVAMVRVSVG
jgi:alpha-N-arabinofuranosidase